MLEWLEKENLVADFISCIKHEDDDIPIDDSFLDEHLFSLSVNTPWFADMEKYLVLGSYHLICHLMKSAELLHKVLTTLGLAMTFFVLV